MLSARFSPWGRYPSPVIVPPVAVPSLTQRKACSPVALWLLPTTTFPVAEAPLATLKFAPPGSAPRSTMPADVHLKA